MNQFFNNKCPNSKRILLFGQKNMQCCIPYFCNFQRKMYDTMYGVALVYVRNLTFWDIYVFGKALGGYGFWLFRNVVFCTL